MENEGQVNSQESTDSLPDEQKEYLKYKNERRLLYEDYHRKNATFLAVSDKSRQQEIEEVRKTYLEKYGFDPETDDFFLREVASCKELLEKLYEGNGARYNLPVLVDGKPIAVSAYHLTSDPMKEEKMMRLQSPTAEFSMQDFLAGLREEREPISDVFFLDVGFVHPNGTLESFAKCDFFVKSTNAGKVGVGWALSGDSILRAVVAPAINRDSIESSMIPFKVNSAVLRKAGLHGLGRMTFALSNYLSGRAGASKRIVENDATSQMKGRSSSFYVHEMGAEMEEYKNSFVPAFQTKDFALDNRLNGFAGYWLPK